MWEGERRGRCGLTSPSLLCFSPPPWDIQPDGPLCAPLYHLGEPRLLTPSPPTHILLFSTFRTLG